MPANYSYLVLITCLWLSACGGGGGSDDPPAAQPPVTEAPTQPEPEPKETPTGDTANRSSSETTEQSNLQGQPAQQAASSDNYESNNVVEATPEEEMSSGTYQATTSVSLIYGPGE